MIETLATGGMVVSLLGIVGYMMKRWSEKIDTRFDKLSTEIKENTKTVTAAFKEQCADKQASCVKHMDDNIDHLRSAVKYIHEDRQIKWSKQQDINELIKVHIELNGRMKGK